MSKLLFSILFFSILLFAVSIYLIVFYSKLIYLFKNVLEQRNAKVIDYENIQQKKMIIQIDRIAGNQVIMFDHIPKKDDQLIVYINPNDLSQIYTQDESLTFIFYLIVSVILLLFSLILFYMYFRSLKNLQKT